MSSNSKVVGGDETALREFVHHYFSLALWTADEPTVFIGQLPEDALPFQLPMPPSAQILGSIIRDEPTSEVLLRAALTAEEVVQFYESALVDAGWQIVAGIPLGPRGFVNREVRSQQFCNDAAGVLLNLNVSDSTAGGSTARFYINRQPNPCQTNRPGHMVFSLLPTLHSPIGVRMLPGSQMSGGGGMMGRQSANMSAQLETDLPIAELVAAYHELLKKSDWELLSAETGKQYAFSTWSFRREDTLCNGMFTLTAHPKTQGVYFAVLQVQEGAF